MRPRAPAVAGIFYPDKPQELAAAVKAYLADANAPARAGAPKAIVAPHAGYIYSGPIAGTAYASLAQATTPVSRVVLVGPSHRLAFPGVATSAASAFESPVGPLHLDRDLVTALVDKRLAREFDAAHKSEHSLEVQLPFIKHLFPEAHLIPLLAGDEDWRAMAQAIEHVWGGDETVFVVSSDLSHYHDYATAKNLDSETAALMEGLAAGDIGVEQACGATALNALLAVAASKGLHCTTLDLRSSGDTAGPRERVVGYGAFALA